MKDRFVLTALLAAVLALAGCASTQVGARLILPPTTIVGDPRGLRGDVYDAYDLFDRGDKAYVQGDWPTAAAYYQKLLGEYPDAEVAPLARYNLGLVYGQLDQWDKALAIYDSFSQPPPRGVRSEEVRMRRGICLMRLNRYAEAQQEFAKILQQFGVPALEFNEARARLGAAAFYANDEITAEHYLNLAAQEFEVNAKRGVVWARAAFAEGYFVLGEIQFRRFQAVDLAGAGPTLNAALHQKAAAFLVARDLYTKVVRTMEPSWVTAAMFRVGEGYELFYKAVLAVPDPPDLAPPERPAYRRALADKLKPALDKALLAYRRNLEIAVDLRVENDWTRQTRERYAALSRLAQEDPQ